MKVRTTDALGLSRNRTAVDIVPPQFGDRYRHGMTSARPLLLDRKPLEGPKEIIRQLCLHRSGRLVATYDEGCEAIESLSQTWGGFASYLVPPAAFNNGTLEPPWAEFVRRADVDRWDGAVGEQLKRGAHSSPAPVPIAALLASLDTDRSRLAPIEVPHINKDDPWHLAYTATFGVWPDAPDHALHRGLLNLRHDLTYDDFVETRQVEVTGDLEDYLERLTMLSTHYPILWTRSALSVDLGFRDTNLFPSTPYWVSAERRLEVGRFGPNLVVLYEPGSVDDLCLLWSIRASRGAEQSAPIAIPISHANIEDLRSLESRGVFHYFGGGAARGLLSCSIPRSDLEEMCGELGDPWSTLDLEIALDTSEPPTHWSSDVAVFESGRASVVVDVQRQSELRTRVRSIWRMNPTRFRIGLAAHSVPPSRSLWPDTFVAGYRGGYFDGGTPSEGASVEFRWPTGWTVVEALARDLGLEVRMSEPGRVAVAFCQRVGVDELHMLGSWRTIDLLDQLSQKKGITWFRRRAAELAGRLEEADQEKIDEFVKASSVSDFEEAVSFGFDKIRDVLGLSRDATDAWIEWAENRGILIRGVEMDCDRCGTSIWKTVAEIIPPIVCPACGSSPRTPFRSDGMKFKYRASEFVLRLFEFDAITHVHAMRWFFEAFEAPFSDRSVLYGAHPGVEIVKNGEVVGEIDLLLVFYDGVLGVGECKKSAPALTSTELDKLREAADHVNAEFTVAATLSPAVDCPPIWTDSVRHLPDRPHYAIPGEVLLQSPIHPGRKLFEWPEVDWDRADIDSSWESWVEREANRLQGQGDPDFDRHEAWARDDS